MVHQRRVRRKGGDRAGLHRRTLHAFKSLRNKQCNSRRQDKKKVTFHYKQTKDPAFGPRSGKYCLARFYIENYFPRRHLSRSRPKKLWRVDCSTRRRRPQSVTCLKCLKPSLHKLRGSAFPWEWDGQQRIRMCFPTRQRHLCKRWSRSVACLTALVTRDTNPLQSHPWVT